MSIQKLNEDVSVVSTLPDKPTLTSSEIKKVFDQGSETIKNYINNILIPAIESGNVTIVNDLVTGGSTKVASAETVKKLNTEKQSVIGYGTSVPVLAEGQIFIQIFD